MHHMALEFCLMTRTLALCWMPWISSAMVGVRRVCGCRCEAFVQSNWPRLAPLMLLLNRLRTLG
jgi:hypothetical protein